MIEVILFKDRERHDTAEAVDEGGAVLAARTMRDDAMTANPYQGFSRSLTVGFFVDGQLVREVDARRI